MTRECPMQVKFRKLEDSKHKLFEFTIACPLLRSQFQIPKKLVNEMRIELERAILEK